MTTSTSNSQLSQQFQLLVTKLGCHATSPYPAYSLSALFLLSSPFSFNPNSIHSTSNPIQSTTTTPSNSFTASLKKAFKSKRPVTPLPPFYVLVSMAIVFGGGGYIIDQGDVLNGSGTVSAWSILYLLFRTIPSIKKPTVNGLPIPILLTTTTLALGLGIHGSHYFDRTSWKGVIPDRQLLENSPSKTSSFGSGSGFGSLEKTNEKVKGLALDTKKRIEESTQSLKNQTQELESNLISAQYFGFFNGIRSTLLPNVEASADRKRLIEEEIQSRSRKLGF